MNIKDRIAQREAEMRKRIEAEQEAIVKLGSELIEDETTNAVDTSRDVNGIAIPITRAAYEAARIFKSKKSDTPWDELPEDSRDYLVDGVRNIMHVGKSFEYDYTKREVTKKDMLADEIYLTVIKSFL